MKAFYFLVVLLAIAGCAAPYAMYSGDSPYAAHGVYARGYHGYSRPVPVPPTRIGFHRPPIYWHGNMFSFQIRNETKEYHARCIIDGQEHMRTLRGAVLQAHVRTPQGLRFASLIPPGEASYFVSDGTMHNMRCELYSGPVQILPNGAFVFKKMRQRWIYNWTPDQFPNREYVISDMEVTRYDRVR